MIKRRKKNCNSNHSRLANLAISGAVSIKKQHYKQLKFNKLRLCMWIIFNNMLLKANHIWKDFSDLNQQKYVQSENLKYQIKFEDAPKKPELRFLTQKWRGLLQSSNVTNQKAIDFPQKAHRIYCSETGFPNPRRTPGDSIITFLSIDLNPLSHSPYYKCD